MGLGSPHPCWTVPWTCLVAAGGRTATEPGSTSTSFPQGPGRVEPPGPAPVPQLPLPPSPLPPSLTTLLSRTRRPGPGVRQESSPPLTPAMALTSCASTAPSQSLLHPHPRDVDGCHCSWVHGTGHEPSDSLEVPRPVTGTHRPRLHPHSFHSPRGTSLLLLCALSDSCPVTDTGKSSPRKQRLTRSCFGRGECSPKVVIFLMNPVILCRELLPPV